jgi:hypothetical protein
MREVEKYLNVNASEIRAAFAKRIRADDFVQVVRGPQFGKVIMRPVNSISSGTSRPLRDV